MNPIVDTKQVGAEGTTMSPFGIALVSASVAVAALAAFLGYMLGDGSKVLGAAGGASLLVAVVALALAPLPSSRRPG
jgi:hypothetical protein